MLRAGHQAFCDGVVSGLNATDAYATAYPEASRRTAGKRSSELMKRPEVQAEIARQQALAREIAGPAVLTLIEKRVLFARVVRACPATLPLTSDLWMVKRTDKGAEYVFPDKFKAVAQDCAIAGDEEREPGAEDALRALLRRIRE